MNGEPLDWDSTCEQLQHVMPPLDPATLHGLLCGNTCAGGGLADADWLERIRQHSGPEAVQAGAEQPLLQFRNAALVNLGDADFGFQLLLPSADASIGDRLEALSGWCSAFLSGFGLGGGRSEALDADAGSGLRDLAAIAALDPDSGDDPDAEADLAELIEYVRVVVQMLLQQRPEAAS